MSVEFIGYVSHQKSSEIHLPKGPAVNPPWIAAVAKEDGAQRAAAA